MTVSKTIPPSPTVPDKLVVSSFGVKHGDCTLVEYVREGVVRFRLLCDAGVKAPDALFTQLAKKKHERGTGYIDVVVLTHVDQDHQGGLPAIFKKPGIEVGEYWGPCLPAFRRLRWLFQNRVINAIDKAAELEKLVLTSNVPVVYPLEGHIKTTPDRRVTVSVISPAPRLIKELAHGGKTAIRSLVTNAPLPMEWLVTGAQLGSATEDQVDISFSSRTYLGPEDFASPLPEVRFDSSVDLEAEAVAGGSASAEPNFFGNHVLNDTSLVLVIDVLLDDKRRRRVLLTGDQENWTYIASKYPTGLGVDILKVPHHGGKVFLADKHEENAIEQMYLWLRPRVAMVSAMGQHKLPHVRTREALRQAGATLFCPNTRGFESLSSGAVLTDSHCCFDAYGCRQKASMQTEVVAVTLTAKFASAQVPACLQGTLHHGPAPIVVQTQRIIEPDEAFVRWTRTEVQKQANWIQDALLQRHLEFKTRKQKSGELYALVADHVGVTWGELLLLARAKGHLHLVADPEPALRFALAKGLILQVPQSSHRNLDSTTFYLPPKPAEVDEVRQWVRNVPDFIFTMPTSDDSSVRTGNRLALLRMCNMETLSIVAAHMLSIPMQFVVEAIMPTILMDLANDCCARACNADRPWEYIRGGNAGMVLHLYRDKPAAPDIFGENWTEGYWESGDTASRLKFVLDNAPGGVLLEVDQMQNMYRHKNPFRGFMSDWDYGYGSTNYVPDRFPSRFAEAQWIAAWTANKGVQ